MSVLLPTWKGAWLQVLEHSSKVGECSRHCTPISTDTQQEGPFLRLSPHPLAAVTAQPPDLALGSKGALGRSPWRALPSWPGAQHGACGPKPASMGRGGKDPRPFWLLRTNRDEATLCSFCWGMPEN